jgi:hypothetical protein
MISPEEIKRLAQRWWREVLLNAIDEGTYFPKEITRIGRIKPSNVLRDFQKIQDELILLRENSKEVKGFGYSIAWEEVKNQKVGKNSFPVSIAFETLEDYLKFIKKEKEFKKFKTCSHLICSRYPKLLEWIKSNPEQIIDHEDNWNDLLKVCEYFIRNPKPNLYIRELPIDIHTKFIQQNETIITSLLQALISEHTDNSQRIFERRFNLKYDQPMIRIRFLDESIAFQNLLDVTIPLNDFELLHLDCKNIILTENKMNFLTLPKLKNTLAIWTGGGFNIKFLKGINWMFAKRIFYFGDLDTHGFLILDQMRGYYPQTQSILMNWETYKSFESFLKAGKPISNYNLTHLSDEESEIYTKLKSDNLRLEQERIPNEFIISKLKSIE